MDGWPSTDRRGIVQDRGGLHGPDLERRALNGTLPQGCLATMDSTPDASCAVVLPQPSLSLCTVLLAGTSRSTGSWWGITTPARRRCSLSLQQGSQAQMRIGPWTLRCPGDSGLTSAQVRSSGRLCCAPGHPACTGSPPQTSAGTTPQRSCWLFAMRGSWQYSCRRWRLGSGIVATEEVAYELSEMVAANSAYIMCRRWGRGLALAYHCRSPLCPVLTMLGWSS